MLGGEERSICEVIVSGRPLKHALELKYLRLALNKAGIDIAEC